MERSANLPKDEEKKILTWNHIMKFDS
jgi:hypothetical protein